jgi:hypothetical protein
MYCTLQCAKTTESCGKRRTQPFRLNDWFRLVVNDPSNETLSGQTAIQIACRIPDRQNLKFEVNDVVAFND